MFKTTALLTFAGFAAAQDAEITITTMDGPMPPMDGTMPTGEGPMPEKMDDGEWDSDKMGGDKMEKMEDDKMGMMGKMDMMMDKGKEAQMVFLSAAVSSTTYYALDLFRYKGNAFYDDLDVFATTNYARLGAQVGRYAGLSLWGLASLTQMLSMFGVAAEVNLAVWMYGLGVGGGLAGMTSGVMTALAYDQAYQYAATNAAVSAAGMSLIRAEMVESAVVSIATMLTLASHGEAWFMAQMKSMGGKDGMGGMEKMEGKDGDWEKDGEWEKEGEWDMSMEKEGEWTEDEWAAWEAQEKPEMMQ